MTIERKQNSIVIKCEDYERITSLEEAKEVYKSEDLNDSVRVLQFLFETDYEYEDLVG